MAERDVTFNTGLSIEQLQKDLNQARKAIESYQAKFDKVSAKHARMADDFVPLVERIKELRAAVAEYEATLAHAPESNSKNFAAEYEAWQNAGSAIGPAKEELKELEARFAKMEPSVRALSEDLVSAGQSLQEAKDHACVLEEELEKAQQAAAETTPATEDATEATDQLADSADDAGSAFDGINKSVNRIYKRIGGLLKRVLFFSVITSAFRKLRSFLSDTLKQNEELNRSLASLKGAAMTAVTPLINAIIPALIRIVQWATKAATAIAQLIGWLTGKSLKDMQKSAKALSKVGAAGKEASKSLASFDTVQTLNTSSSGGSGASDMGAIYDQAALTNAEIIKTLAYIASIIAALLVLKKFGVGKELLGTLIAIVGFLLFIDGYLDAWENGITFENLTEMLGGIAIALLGIYLAFGPAAMAIAGIIAGVALLVLGFKDLYENGLKFENITAILAGVGLAMLGLIATGHTMLAGVVAIAAGVALFVLSLKDAIENGVDFKNVLGMIAGLVLTGLGLGILTGSTIPLLIAAILSIIVAVTAVGGTFEQLVASVKQLFSGLMKFFKGVFTGDWEMVWEGIKDIFKGIVNLILSIFGGVVNTIIKGLNWLISKLNKISFDVPEWVPGIGGKHLGVNIPSIGLWDVPQLAQGAVIPPNRQFLAVLGDQKSGTNIEAPLDTIVAAFRQVMLEGGGQDINIHFTGSMAQFVAMLDKQITISRRNRGK